MTDISILVSSRKHFLLGASGPFPRYKRNAGLRKYPNLMDFDLSSLPMDMDLPCPSSPAHSISILQNLATTRKVLAPPAPASAMNLRTDVTGMSGDGPDPTVQARRHANKSARGPWATDAETDGETEGEGAMSESDFEIASTLGHGPGESTHGGRAVQRQAAGKAQSATTLLRRRRRRRRRRSQVSQMKHP